MRFFRPADPAAHFETSPDKLRATVLLALAFVASYVVATWATVLVVRLGDFADAIALGRGPHKIMRRFQLVIVLLTIPWILRRSCWAGWRDVGWTPGFGQPVPPCWWRHLLLGFGVGAAMLSVVAVWSVSNGSRVLDADVGVGRIAIAGLSALVSCLLIGVFEETIARGLLFRATARLWSLWPAALITSFVFALGHFLKPFDEAFYGDGVARTTLQALASNWERMIAINQVGLRIFNLTLMAVVLCVVVMRTRTIWLAAGLHAGWVWVKLFSPEVTNRAEDAAYSLWTGARTDVTDALLGTVLLLALLVAVLLWPRPRNEEGARDAVL